MDDRKLRGFRKQTVTTVDQGLETRPLVESIAELYAIAGALKNLTSFPEGEGRLSLLTRLLEHEVPNLVDDCKTRLRQLGLKIVHHRETGQE